MSTRRPLVSLLLLAAGFTASACTAILVPDEKDDEVIRCNNTQDCPTITDNRVVSQCVYGEGQADNSDKVCTSAFRTNVGCNPMEYPVEHPLTEAYNDATDNASKALYGNCAPENAGKAGCPSNAGACDAGLELRSDNLCIDPNEPQPTINPSFDAGVELAGKDVLDQFCRWYFCDDSYVCDPNGFTCKPCDPDDPFAEGGCGTIYLNGARSSVYTDVLSDGNCEGDLETEEVSLGPVPNP